MAKEVRRRDPKKEALWQQRLKEWEISGLTAQAFCQQHGYERSTFFWWKSELERRGKWRGRGKKRKTHSLVSPTSPVPLFVPIEVTPSPAGFHSRGETCGVTLVLTSGHRIEIPRGFDVPTLVRLLGVLGGTGC
jgi:hypothetical protein